MIDAVATVIVLGTCFSSDLLQERPKHIMAVATLSIVSLSIVAGVQSSPKVRYTFLALGQSISSSVPNRLTLERRIGGLGMQSHDLDIPVQYHR